MLERAAAELQQLGAIHHRDAAERELRRIGHRTYPRIADELFLSTKTVETHIRNIFGTRGADSRIEVAGMVEQADGVAASNR